MTQPKNRFVIQMMFVPVGKLKNLSFSCLGFLENGYTQNGNGLVYSAIEKVKKASQFSISTLHEEHKWGEWPSGLRRCNQNWKVPSSKPARRSAGLRDPTSLRGSQWPPGRTCINAVINIGLLRLSPQRMAQSWPWSSQIAVKKIYILLKVLQKLVELEQ